MPASVDRSRSRHGFAAIRFAVLAVVLIAASLAPALPARSADPGSEKPKSETLETLRDMAPEAARNRLAGMTDQETRAILMQELDRMAAPTRTEPAMTSSAVLLTLNSRFKQVLAEAPNLPSIGPLVLERITGGEGPQRLLPLAGIAILVFGMGFAAEALFRQLIRPSRGARAPDMPTTQGARLSILFARFMSDAAALAVFAASAFVVFLVTVEKADEATALALSTIFWPLIIIRATVVAARFLLAPDTPALRLPVLDDAIAKALYRRILFVVGLYVTATYLYIMVRDSGISPELNFLFVALLSLIVVLAIITAVWRGWWILAAILSWDVNEPGRRDRLLHLFVDRGYLAVAFMMTAGWAVNSVSYLLTGTNQQGALSTTIILLLSLPAIDWMLREMVSSACKVSRDWIEAEPEPKAGGEGTARESGTALTIARRQDYRDVIVRNARRVIAVIAVFVLSKVWNINLQTMAASSVGERLAEALFHVVAILIVASAAVGILRTAIRHAVPPEKFEGIGTGEPGSTRGSRAQTLVPLVGKFIMAAVVVVAALLILADLGVDIGPLIAGAGVVGIAIGFGAQALIRDILSGLFFLADDAFRIGEYIDVGTVKGTVERISIRSMRLRHHRGQLNTIPYGEVRHLTNFSRDWAIMKLELRLPFDVDLEKVRKLIKKVGVELMDHPEYGQHFIQPVKSQGVNRLDDSGLIVRVKFMTQPNEQWTIRREVFRRIQEVFAENDIHFAPRRVIVEEMPGQSLTPAMKAAADAAIAAGEETEVPRAKSAAASM